MRRNLLRILFVLASCSIVYFSKTNASGPGAGYTNAPSENNCTGCHTGSLQTSGTKWGNIQLTDNFTGSGYIPDSTYTLKLKYKETGKSKWGYQITALDGTGTPAGTFSTPDTRSQVYSASVSGKTRSYLGHTGSGNSSNDTIEYKITWKAPSSNVGPITYYVTLNQADGGGGTSSDVIYAKTFTASASSLLPTAKVKIKDSVFCSTQQLTFDPVLTNSPSKFEWQFPGTSPSTSTSQSPKISYTNTGSYKAILRVKNGKGYSFYDTLTFTVVQGASSPLISPSGTGNLCKGDTLSIRTTQPTTGHTYLWNTGQTTSAIKITDSGNYFVTVKNTNKCFKSSSITNVVWKTKPSITLIKSFSGDTVCSNYPFTAAPLITTAPADSFSFISAKGPFSKTDTIQRMLASGSATYNAWAKNTFGCISAKSSITIKAKQPSAAPVVVATNISYTSIRFAWSNIALALSYRISLDTGKTWLTPTLGDTGHYYDLGGLIGNTSLKAQVIALTSGHCTQSLTGEKTATTLTCSPIPFTAVPLNISVCKNGSTQIILNGLKGLKIGVKIDGIFKGTDTMQTITVKGTKNFLVSVIDSAGVICGYTNKQVLIKEDTVKTPTTNLGTVSQFCTPNSTAAQAVIVTKGANLDSVAFVLNNAIVAVKTTTTHSYIVKNNDSIWVLGKNVRGCLGIPSNLTKILVNPAPTASFIKTDIPHGNKFKAAQTGGIHTWKLDTFSMRSGDSNTYDLFKQSNKLVKMVHTITANGCTSKDSLEFTVTNFVDLKTTSTSLLNIYPNPANDRLNIVMGMQNISAKIEFYNATGQLLQSNILRNGNNSIKILLLPAGIIHYKIVSTLNTTTGSIVIER